MSDDSEQISRDRVEANSATESVLNVNGWVATAQPKTDHIVIQLLVIVHALSVDHPDIFLL